jgi:hypothetical protein
MARHRHRLDKTILRALQEEGELRVGQIRWLDFPFDPGHKQNGGIRRNKQNDALVGEPAIRPQLTETGQATVANCSEMRVANSGSIVRAYPIRPTKCS